MIDMHSHVYVRDAQGVAEWIATMDAVGIERTIVMNQCAGNPRHVWFPPGGV